MKSNFLIRVILIASLIVSVIPAHIEAANVELSYDDSVFKVVGENATKNVDYPDYMYSSGAVPTSGIISLNDTDFEMNGNYEESDGKDVIKINANQEVEFIIDNDGKYTKKISILGAGYTEDVTADIKLYYADGTEKTVEDINIGAMTTEGAVSHAMGKGVIVKASGRLLKFAEGEDDVYLNYAEVEPAKAKLKKFSLNTDKDMFAASINYIEYTQQEVQGDMEENLKLWDKYKNLTFKDISASDTEELYKLSEALKQAKITGNELGTDENIEFVENLLNGYLYYKEISEQTNNIEAAAEKYITDGEFKISAEEISDSQTAVNDLEVLYNLLKDYEANNEKTEELKKIYTYFEIEYDIKNISYTSEMVREYIKEINTSVTNNDTTVPDQRCIELEYDTDLFFSNGGANSGEWEALSESFYQLANFNVNIITWNNGNKFEFDIKPAIKTESGEYKEGTTQGKVTFEYSQNRLHSDSLYNNDGRGKDTVKVVPGGNGAEISMSSKAANSFYLLAPVMDGVKDIAVDANYTDGTTENIQCTVLARPSSWETKYNCDYYMAAKFGYPGRLYNNQISNIDFELAVYKIPLNAEKQIKSLKFKPAEKEYFIMGINEVPLSNAALKTNIEKIYREVVDNGNIKSDVTKLKQFVGYYNEITERNMKLSSIDENLVYIMQEMIVEIRSSLYRKDKSAIKAEFEFNVPVDTNTLKTRVFLNDTEIKDYKTTVSNSDKKMEIEIPADKYTNGNISVVIDKSLSSKKYPGITILYDYEISNRILEFITAELDENTGLLTLKNNSQTSQKCMINSGVYSSDKSEIHYAASESTDLDAGAEITKLISLYSAYNTMKMSNDVVFYLSVTDENLKPICEVSSVESAGKSIVGANYKEPVLELDTNTLKVNGYADKNEIVTIKISDTDKAVYTDNILTNDDGYFDFEIIIKESNVSHSGYLTIEIGAESFLERYVNNEVYYSIQNDRIGVINRLAYATTTEEIKAVLKDAEKMLALNFTPFTVLRENGTYEEALASRILENVDKFEKISDADAQSVKTQKISNGQLLIKQLSVLEAIAQGLEDAVIGKDGLMYDDVMKYSLIDTNGITLYNIYKNAVLEEGMNKIHKAIMSKNYTDTAALMADLEENIAVYAIKNPKTAGTGHIVAVLTKENADAVDINIEKYLNTKDKTDINKYILNSSFSNVKGIENIITEYKSSTGSNSSSSSGGGSGSNGNNGGNSKPMVITNPFTLTGTDNTTSNDSIFTDVAKSHWAYEAIVALFNKGIISGKGENVFEPEASLTRAELVKLLCEAKNINVEYSELKFADVKQEDWFAPYVAAAYKKGWIYGVCETEFAPNQKVTRQDICTIIYRIGDIENVSGVHFNDYDTISEYAKDAVSSLGSAGIITGFEDKTFRPFEYCTRAQATVIIYKYINK